MDKSPRAHVIWITGFPASGKTTLALALKAEYESRGLPVEHLDGDEIRKLFPSTGFDRESRDQHIRRVGHLASRLQAHGVTVIVSLVSPFQTSRDFARNLSQNFFEVHLTTPIGVCETRDPKGLYRKARTGEISNLTGIQSDFETPSAPELKLDTSTLPLEACVKQVLSHVLP